jgi:hypothetical protein
MAHHPTPARPARLRSRVTSCATAVAIGAGVVLVSGALGTATASASASASYYLGSDSNGPVANGHGYPYSVPGTGGLYAGYGGEIGTWTNWRGCTTGTAFNLTDVRAVDADERAGAIPGLSFYWFMAGPGADPSYNGSEAEAYRWGVRQAERVDSNYDHIVALGYTAPSPFTPLVYMDIEGQPEPGYANGWNEIVNHCGQITKVVVIPSAVDRSTFNGFYNTIHEDTPLHPGVYSTPDFWTETFGDGTAAAIPDTDEWTPVTSTGRTTPTPDDFTQGQDSATWFGGVTAAHRVAWQWTQNGGDWDQWDTADLP